MSPFADRAGESVSALGEEGLIASIRGWLGGVSPPSPFGIGDDCAVLPASRGPRLVTVDPVILGRHFDATLSPRKAGAKLLKRNLSDIAAMGGRPDCAVVSLVLGSRVRTAWLAQFHRGVAAAARKWRVAIVGGDVSQSVENRFFCASLTLIGTSSPGRVLMRTGAGREDWIYVTGVLGGSLASGHHHRFTPRLAEGQWCARNPAVTAMIDLSDGLAKDIRALTPPGSVPAIAPEDLPRRKGIPLDAALTDGEDYELLFTVASGANCQALERRWRKDFPRTRLTCLGSFVPLNEAPRWAIPLRRFHGYRHLAG